MTIHIVTNNVLTSRAIPADVEGIAQVQVGTDSTLIMRAAQNMITWKQTDIEKMVQEVLEGHQRGIVSVHTMVELIADKAKLQSEILKQCVPDLEAMGIKLVSYTIKDIDDSNGFLLMLGEKITCEKKSQAQIGE
eukprot:Pgem_evm1s4654